jgi:transposase
MRPPEVFVRELAPHEGQRLKRLSKQSKLASTRQRALILLASNTMTSAPRIARMLLTDESHVRRVIHDFNQHGWDSLRPGFRGGRPRRIQTEGEQRIVAVAGARPDTLGVPSTRWSLAKLSATCTGRGSRSRPRSWAGSSPATGFRCNAPAAGSRAPTPTTSRRRRGSSPSIGKSRPTGS